MPTLSKKLTDSVARALPAPSENYVLYWCGQTPGFGLRVAAGGGRSWIFERRVDGRTKRRTLGRASGRAAISSDAARSLALQRSGELEVGRDVAAERREARAAERQDTRTLADAIDAFVADNAARRKPLKPRTRRDYEEMVKAPRLRKNGKPTSGGPLYPLADRRLSKLTAEEIKAWFIAATKTHGPTRAGYAARVLRAALAYEGLQIEDNPFSRDTAKKARIVIPAAGRRDAVIPAERLGQWWAACASASNQEAADAIRLLLLTGLRRGELLGDTRNELPGVRVSDVDLEGGRIRLHDTKNRKPHVVALSTQALEIVARHVKGKKKSSRLFPACEDPRKTLEHIVAESGVAFSLHDMRRTFATIAAQILPVYTVKAMLNHSGGNDITQAHYVRPSEAVLREAWQRVADHIMEKVAEQTAEKGGVRIVSTKRYRISPNAQGRS